MTDDEPTVALVPTTGELVEIGTAQTDELSDALLAIRERQDELRNVRKAIEDELRRRVAARGRRQIAHGDFEVHIDGGKKSVWDPDELEGVLRDLVDEGTLAAGECADVFRTERKVMGSVANRIAKSLTGEPAERVEACRTWAEDRSVVRIERAVALPDPQNPALRAVP